MNKKCCPHSELSDLPPMESEKAAPTKQYHVLMLQSRQGSPVDTYCDDCGIGRCPIGENQCEACKRPNDGCIRITFEQITKHFLGDGSPYLANENKTLSDLARKRPLYQSNGDGTVTAKMPHRMKDVKSQIENHPRYKELDNVTQWSYEGCGSTHLTHITRDNNAWVRMLWKKLYWDWSIEPQ